MEEKTKIVVTGALGHIGSWLSTSLGMHSNLEITLVDNFYTQRYCSLIGMRENTKFIEADFSECEDVIKKADVIIHLAACNEVLRGEHHKDEYQLNNIYKLKILLKQISKHQRIIFPSTTSIYGSDKLEDMKEDSQSIWPQSNYAKTKIGGEELITRHTDNHYILRLGTIFGVSRGMRFHTAINKFCLQAYLGQELTIWKEYLDHTRPYLGLTDLSNVIRNILGLRDMPMPTGTYNVVSENKLLINIIDIIRLNIKNVKVKLIDSPLRGQKSYTVNCDKIKTYVNLHETVEKGIKSTLEYLYHG